MTQSFIEKQFPVSKVSKESFKERKAVQSQTLTGLGKWWGRKPLILTRATIIGCLMPASNNPEKDMEIYLRILGMDETGLVLRKEKSISVADLYSAVISHKKLKKYSSWFYEAGGKIKLEKDAPREEIELAVFSTLGYDEKISLCKRPEHLSELNEQSWKEINFHLGTNATSLPELVAQLSTMRFGHNITIGDCFCGGGSIPFEAARIGCNAYGSDLNPVAGLLSKASLDLLCLTENEKRNIEVFQRNVFYTVNRKILELGIESNENGDRADAYLYCNQAICPECGYSVPLSPSWLLGVGSKSVVELIEVNNGFDFKVTMGASADLMKKAKSTGTVADNHLICPHCKKRTPISVIRKDSQGDDGKTIYGLRLWEKSDFIPRKDDIFGERLYAIRYVDNEGNRYYRSPRKRDMDNENKVIEILAEKFEKWQHSGIIPEREIESGYNTDQLTRERGWKYWHQLFNPRQLLVHALLQEESLKQAKTPLELMIACLSLHRCCNWNSKLCSWGVGQARESMAQTFYNQAFNTMWNYGTRGLSLLSGVYYIDTAKIPYIALNSNREIDLIDARDVSTNADIWITDPPYADAVNYHELTEFFLAWDRGLMGQAMPTWYQDSKRILAVRGDEHFSQTMIDIYTNLANHMPDDGMQIVMFTHSDPAVWAQLALIMWKAGLTVTAAWNITTETERTGYNDGNYVSGTVLLVLRKQQGDEEAFLDELAADIKQEVKRQIESMQKLDDKEDPNFSDPDYVLAAYAASLKVLTGYKAIGEIDLDYELDLAIHDPSKSEVVKLIERAKKIAYDFIIPLDFDNYLWKELSPAERFYIKGLEAEKHGNYQVSTYQEYARGFGLSSYGQMMGSEKANSARLKTPTEFAMRTVSEVPDFESSTLRLVLQAIHIAIKENETPEKGLWHLKNNLNDYWNSRDMLKQLLSFLKDTQSIDAMPHWSECGQMAEHIYVLVDNDHI